MTREEQAIEHIKRYRELDEKLYNAAPKGTVSSIATKKCLEFWDMAIKALSQECVGSTQKHVGNALDMRCEDAISRQAVLEGIEELKKSPWATDKRGNGFEYLITEALDVVADLCVKQEPSVTQKSDKYRKEAKRWKNKWLKSQKSGKWIRTPLLTCDRCNKINKSGEETDYCPNCGAKMVEPQESEDKE